MNKLLILCLFIASINKFQANKIEVKRVTKNQTNKILNGTKYIQDMILSFEASIINDPKQQISIKNFQDVSKIFKQFIKLQLQYYGTVFIGKPQQSMTVIFDTGSTVLWVPTNLCSGLSCHDSNKFNINQSTTAIVSQSEMAIQVYGQGSCIGYEGNDYVSLEGDPINVFSRLLFVYQDQDMEGLQSDGILGLSNEKGYQNIFDLAKKQGILSSSLFTFDIRDTLSQSYLYYGNIPENILNRTIWLKSSRTDYWTIKIIKTQLDGVQVDQQTYKEALIDTGTSVLGVEKGLYDMITQKLMIVCQYNKYFGFMCPCNPTQNQIKQFPKLVFEGEGAILEVSYKQYLIPGGAFGTCQVAIFPISGIPFMIFGDVFLRNYIVTYDKEKNMMGFHNAIQMPQPNIQNIIKVIFILDIIAGFLIIVFYMAFIQIKKKYALQ